MADETLEVVRQTAAPLVFAAMMGWGSMAHAGNTFTDISASLPGVGSSSVAWGDFDNDGHLDMLVSGLDAAHQPLSRIYRNDGQGLFTDIQAGLTGVYHSSAAWGDYDNDGDLDILITGLDASYQPISRIYRNDGQNVFTDIQAGLVALKNSSAAWADYDNDGDLDIFISGRTGSGWTASRLYQNRGDGSFAVIYTGLPALDHSSAAWADYDNDGKLDLLLSGRSSLGQAETGLFRNAGDGSFTPVDTGLVGVFYSSNAWGDYDNDGKPDILMSGRDDTGQRISRVYHNNGDGSFSDISAGLPGVRACSAAWGDYDNDDDLDILITGYDATGTSISRVYRNDANPHVANTAPGAPWGLAAMVQPGPFVQLSWSAPEETETPAAGLSYNLCVGTSPGACDVVGPMSSATDGYRSIAARGPIQGNQWTLYGLAENQEYYWKVQAVDAGLKAGEFSFERSFTTAGVPPPPFSPIDADLTGEEDSTTVFGDYDNDGDLDILITGYYASKVYLNQGDGSFTELAIDLPGIYPNSSVWGDYDNDGDLDVLIMGWDMETYTAVSRVYRNNGNGSFTDVGAGLIGVRSSSAAWGDYDNDGDLDILISGRSGSWQDPAPVSLVYRNTGNDSFSVLDAGLTGVNRSSVAWGDYDNDGDLDILISGYDDVAERSIVKVYGNSGNGSFTGIAIDLSGLESNSAIWGDYDNDGDLDILVSGYDYDTYQSVSRLYRNDGNESFTGTGTVISGLRNTSAAWGDYDRDGDLDILISGYDDAADQSISRVYRNNGNGSFTDIGARMAGLRSPSAVWGDYDRDGDLDILVSGYDATYQPIIRLYRNNCDRFFTDISAGLPGVYASSVAWGDYDNDGDLDILISGMDPDTYQPITRLYGNNGSGSFTNVAELPEPYFSSVAWGDYDNDGDLDILISGSRYGKYQSISRIYRNDGNGSFTDIGAGLPEVFASAAAWGDYDNDGDLDILISGMDATGQPIIKVYRNDGDVPFVEIDPGLPGGVFSSVAWGDYDNDGDLDILISGLDILTTGEGERPNPISRVYRNNGDDSFTDINAGLTGVFLSSAAWGDYDNDGDLDILISGFGILTTGEGERLSPISRVYRNNGDDSFTDINAGLTGVILFSAAWGDYDNDGDLDILISGLDYDTYQPISGVYRNDGNDSFSDIGTRLAGGFFSSAAWGDYDNDGKLDILITGSDANETPVSKVFRNIAASHANTAPGTPSGLSAWVQDGPVVRLTWGPPADTESPVDGLSYNLCVGTSPGACDVVGPMADSENGSRLVAARGPIQGTRWTLNDLVENQDYYWRVQAVDTGLKGGEFSAEGTFTAANGMYPSSCFIQTVTPGIVRDASGKARASWDAPPLFSWIARGLKQYVLEFSNDPEFHRLRCVLPGRWWRDRLLQETSYMPSPKEWRRLVKKVGGKDEPVYWRVWGWERFMKKDPADSAQVSDIASFSF